MSPKKRPSRQKRQVVPRPLRPDGSRESEDARSSGRSQQDQPQEFFPISLASLRLETITGFSLYLHHPKQDSYVLYRRGNLTFGEVHRERLRASRVKQLYIASSQRGAYLRYVEEHLDQILSDPNLSDAEKNEVFYGSATNMMEDLFANPSVGANVRRTKAFIGTTVHHLIAHPDNTTALIELLNFDYSTFSHSVNVCIFGLALASRLGYSSRELDELGIGLMLHDIGKSKIDDAILFKPGALDEDEWAVIRMHPDLGLELVEQATHLSEDSAAVIHQHHERCNGEGYPQNLTAEYIHPYAKIGAVCDVFDAMTTRRCYRDAVPSYDAIFEMQETMGHQLDRFLLREMVVLMGPIRDALNGGFAEAA